MTYTVKELIQKLEKFDPDMPVVTLAAYNFYPIIYAYISNKQIILKTANIGGELSETIEPKDNTSTDFDPDPNYPNVA